MSEPSWTETLAEGSSPVVVPPEVPERWRLLRPLGEGGQGQVWLADDRTLSQRVALKIVSLSGDTGSGRQRRSLREARIGRGLSHPNLVRIHDLVETEGAAVVVMEWLSGGSAKDRLMNGPLAVAEVIRTAEHVLAALESLHAKGIVHRDVKPSNLLCDGNGVIKLADLGLARELTDQSGVTRTGTAVGTPDYMSPEQLRGEQVGPASDLYSLGVTLYQLLTGKLPFTGSSEFDVADGHLREAARPVRALRPECPHWLAAFVHRLLEKLPEDRWRDAASARVALHRRRVVRRRVVRRSVATLLVSSAVVGAVVWAWSWPAGRVLSSVTQDGSAVEAFSDRGVSLWVRDVGAQISSAIVADLHGAVGNEVAVGIREPRGAAEQRCGIIVYSSAGREIVRKWLDLKDFSGSYPDISPVLGISQMLADDVDGDGEDELIWVAVHEFLYPSLVGVWWGRDEGRLSNVLLNSGRIFDLRVNDLDRDGRAEIVVAGLNNPLGYQQFVAVLRPSASIGYSPDLLGYDWLQTVRSYVLLGSDRRHPEIVRTGPGRIEVRSEDDRQSLWTLGTGEGQEAVAAERRFWQHATRVARALQGGALDADGALDQLTAQHPGVLSRNGPRLASVLLLSRAVARSGDRDGAIGLLERALQRDPGVGDLWLMLGQQLLMRGDRQRGREALLRSVPASEGARSPYDAVLSLMLDAALRGDVDGYEQALQVADAYMPMFRTRSADEYAPFWPFWQGELDVAALEPERQSAMIPEGQVMRWWAAYESGRQSADEAIEAARRMAAAGTAVQPARLLQARARLQGEPAAAAEIACDALVRLERSARESFEAFVWLPLGEWTCGSALHASGRSEEAEQHLQRARQLAPEAWFNERSRTR